MSSPILFDSTRSRAGLQRPCTLGTRGIPSTPSGPPASAVRGGLGVAGGGPEEPMMTESNQLIRGLEGVVAAETRLCDLDGKNGRLAYGGYDIDELARQATFEEVTYLLLHGELPKAAELDGFTVALSAAREIPRELVQAFRLMPK